MATLCRVSELASIATNSIAFSHDFVVFSLGKPTKTQRNSPLRSITVKRLPERAIDPVDCLHSYLHATETKRSNEGRLFIGSVKPHKPVGPSTLGKWIKTQLGKAGVDTSLFSAHSTRGAAASKAAAAGVPIDSILKLANWASQSTFERFYRRETLVSTSIESVILDTHI